LKTLPAKKKCVHMWLHCIRGCNKTNSPFTTYGECVGIVRDWRLCMDLL